MAKKKDVKVIERKRMMSTQEMKDALLKNQAKSKKKKTGK